VNVLGRGQLPGYARGLIEPGYRYRVLYGGRGGGRSWSVARVLLAMAWHRPLRILCTRELQTSIRDSVHQLLRDQITLLGLTGFTVTEREIRHTNGSLIVFLGLRYNVEQVKSLEGVDICWVEEAERVPKASWETLIPTIRKPGSEIWITFNPDLESDDTFRRFVQTHPPDAWVKRVGWQDNPWLPDELRREREYLARVDPDAEAHIWGGEVRQSSHAQVLHGKWVVEDVDPQPDWEGPYQGMDFGFATDPTALVQVYVAGDTLHVQQELYRVGLELDATAAACQEAVPGCEACVIRADGARPESISYLKRHGLPRIEAVEKWAGSIEDGIAYLRQFERIVVHSRCRNWIAEARAYSYKVDDRSGDILPVILDKNCHLVDGTRYALAPMIRRRESAFPSTSTAPKRHVRPLFAKATA
jgi:phage terminase large subunit